MEALVTVTLRHREPVAHALRVRLVHIRDDRIRPPALRALGLGRRVEDDADGEEVVDALELSDEIGVRKAAEQLGIPYYTLADWRYIRKH